MAGGGGVSYLRCTGAAAPWPSNRPDKLLEKA